MATLKQKITPHLWYDKEAKEAAQFYCSVFPDSKITNVTTIHDTPSGDCDIVSFTLMGQDFMAISAGPLFKFNEAISFMVHCDNQAEIDKYWSKLSADPKAEQCGWLKDKYGLSWQIVPAVMDKMMTSKDQEKVDRVVQAFLPMKKFDVAKLEKAFAGSPK
jgi:predicted 3-demethylubiquinone-9 3-methyltransferase (glyoxalase superfamily)